MVHIRKTKKYWLKKGNTLNNLRHYEEALAAYEQAIRLDPKFARAYNDKGWTLSNLMRLEEAVADFEQAIRLDPNYAIAYTNKGYAFNGLKRFEEAVAAFEQAIRLKPNLGQLGRAYFGMHSALVSLGRDREATVAFLVARQLGYPG